MTECKIPDLEAHFELVDAPAGQLDDAISPAIAQEELHRTYWNLTFHRVQYGTFRDQHACVLVVEGKLHAEDSRRHRFTWYRLKIGFKGAASPIEVLGIAPHLALGISVPEQRASNWALNFVGAAISQAVRSRLNLTTAQNFPLQCLACQ